ncbi:MAG: hypothetical protein V2A56_02085 [bacterium]
MATMIGYRRAAIGMILLAALLALMITGSGCDNGAVVDPLADVVVVLDDTISVSRTLIPDSTYLLRGTVVVSALVGDTTDPTLTIMPGTVILGEKSSMGNLIITKRAYIDAQGTISSPIVFSSDQPVGSRAAGDRGSIMILGEAPSNDGYFVGGSVDNDSSGTMRYVRIEFAGGEGNPSGFGFYGVGSGTRIDYVQVHRSLGTAVDILGGTVSLLHLLVTQPGDWGIRWDNGWTGEGQFWIVQAGQQSAVHGSNYPSPIPAEPRSAPVLYNLTLVASDGPVGIEWAGGTAGILRNSILQGFQTAVRLTDSETAQQVIDSMLIMSHSMVYGCDTLADSHDISPDFFDVEAWLADTSAVIRTTNPELADPNNLDSPVFTPASGNPANRADSLAALPEGTLFLISASYAGAVQIYNSWVESAWTAFPRN